MTFRESVVSLEEKWRERHGQLIDLAKQCGDVGIRSAERTTLSEASRLEMCADELLTVLQAEHTVASVFDFIDEATKLSGCSWKCKERHLADGDGGGYLACCSHCQIIAKALADAANGGPRTCSSDVEAVVK